MNLTSKQTVVILTALAMLSFFFFLFSFFSFHHGLPTGDSQKSIVWAEQILETGKLPNYQIAISHLNRDPVDFYTPALHVLTAGLLRLGGLSAIGVSAILFSVLTALVAAAIAFHVTPTENQNLSALLAFILTLTQARFLRYLREPGYHYQNIVGELLLFTLILLALHLLERWRWSAFLGIIITASMLVLTHQFSAFLAAFAAFPIVVALAFRYKRAALILIPFVGAFLAAAIPLGLHEKIPDLFTTTPHLRPQIPTLSRTIELMGAAWLGLGLAGLGLMAKAARGNLFRIGFVASTGVFLILSQGPRLGIDIPPARALLYLAVPLSVTGAFFIARLSQFSKVAGVGLAAVVAIVAGSSLAQAFTLSHTVRTNSTLTPGQLELVAYLQQAQRGLSRGQQGELHGVLVDDYNRRSASWVVLSGLPMFTRIGSDLETHMNESHQSALRRKLYLNQLDYEKIFSLGSLPEVAQLMRKQNITWLTGINGSSATHFSRNPALQAVKQVDDITLYALTGSAAGGPTQPNPLSDWLLKPSTLANDIGDKEDTYDYLPASLSATRLSDPQIDPGITYRSTEAPAIPLKFNVGDYVRVLWDQDRTGFPDSSLELYLGFKQPASSLTIQTPAGKEFPFQDGYLLKLEPSELPIDKDGFITLTVNNPSQAMLHFDLIALGLAHTP